MRTTAFLLGTHPALSAAELAAYGERNGVNVTWDLSRLPVALLGVGDFPAPHRSGATGAGPAPRSPVQERSSLRNGVGPAPRSTVSGVGPDPSDLQSRVGGTTMIGELRASFSHLPTPREILEQVPEVSQVIQGKRIIGLSALLCPSKSDLPGEARRAKWEGRSGALPSPETSLKPAELADAMRNLAMDLKRTLGMKGTRVVFPPRERPDLSSAQLLHNKLPQDGIALLFLIAPERVDLVTLDSVQDIESYARRDRGRPAADPGRGMLPPKVAQILLNLSLVPPGGTIYDPFCGVGTIPMEALLMGLHVCASDASSTQVRRTEANLRWLRDQYSMPDLSPLPDSRVFVHDITRGKIPVGEGAVDALVTEGWLGPARTTSPLPHEAEQIFQKVRNLLGTLLRSSASAVRNGGRVVVTVPAFRVKKRVLHFPLDAVRVHGWSRESMVPQAWLTHPLFREASRGTLLYGRPDALVLREVVRWTRV